MIDNFATPGEPITLPADFKGQPTATRQIAAVEKVSVTVLAPYFYYKTQDFGFCSGASSTEKWIRDNSEQIFPPEQHRGRKNRNPAPDMDKGDDEGWTGWKPKPGLDDRIPVLGF